MNPFEHQVLLLGWAILGVLLREDIPLASAFCALNAAINLGAAAWKMWP